ncbi:MAG: hypothetical protein JKX81_09580 [Arenicella sp.]|nr:hypothetical protein [Arenicella sp.]
MSDRPNVAAEVAPIWIEDNPLISRLLHRFIDQCDRPASVRFTQKINAKNWPELYDFSDNNHEFLWKLIEQSLHQDYQIIQKITYDRIDSTEQQYDRATLSFNPQEEGMVRQWLERPKVDSYTRQWQNAILPYPLLKSTSLRQPIRIKNFAAEEILAGFDKAGELIEAMHRSCQAISIRGLSARCFWGDSKFLDKRRNLIYDVFANAQAVVRDRMIMMTVYAPKKLETAIFVENSDSFVTLVEAVKQSSEKDTMAVIYSAGYRGAATLIRQRGQCQFSHINLASTHAAPQFEDWWNGNSGGSPNCYFWGDLDYEGLSILRTLRNNFPQMQAWREGYQAIVDFHQRGLGHYAYQANKDKQRLPLPSGCPYGDTVLLPLLMQSKRFIDQEVVDKAQLIEILAG